MGYLKKVGTVIIYIGATLAFITYLPGLPPDVEFSEYSATSAKELDGDVALNGRLNGAEKLFAGELKGAESFDSYDGQLYTGLHGGYVVRFQGDKIVPVVKFGKKCDGLWQEDKCGRPLGLKFDKRGSLYVTDAYYGIFNVDVKTGKYKLLVNISQPIDGKVPLIPNSLDVADNGDIYWTDSSMQFKLYDGTYALLSNPAGRLIRYNAATKKSQVLLENLAFVNGVILSKDESFLLLAETTTSRIVKYNLKGPKAGKAETVYEGLPGMPDNIHSDGKDGFLVSIIAYADSEHPELIQSIIPHPYIRKMFARLLKCLELPFLLIQDFYPNVYAEKLVHMMGSFETIKFLMMPRATVLRLDSNGKIIEAAYSTDEQLVGMSSGFVHNNYLWLGSPFIDYVARVPLRQAFPNLAQALASEPVQRKQAHVSQSPPPKKTTAKEAHSTTEPPPVSKPSSARGSRGSESEQIRKPREVKVTESVKPTAKPVVQPQTTVPTTTTPPPTTTQAPKPAKKATPKATSGTTASSSAPTTAKPSTTAAPKPTPKPTVKPTAKPVAKPTEKVVTKPAPTPAPMPASKKTVNANAQTTATKEAKKEAGKVEMPKQSPPPKKPETPEKKPVVKPTESKAKPSGESVKQKPQSTESKSGKPTQAKNRLEDEF